MKILRAVAIVLVVAACAPAATPGWTYGPIASAITSASGSPDASAESPSSASPAASPAPSASVDPAVGDAIPFTVKDFSLDPVDLTVVGSKFALAVTNEGPTLHNITIRDGDGTVLGATKDLREGASEVISFDLQPGTYTTFCSLPGHESLGIVGSLTVSP